MNNLERVCGEAVRAYLADNSPQVAAVPIMDWDSEEEATIPRLSLKVEQKTEMVWGMGVYSLSVEVATTVLATDNVSDPLDKALQKLLVDAGFLDAELTTAHFHCFGRMSGAVRDTKSDEGKRTTSLQFEVVGFDLDRFI